MKDIWMIITWEQIVVLIAAIMGLAQVVVNLTPTEKDNKIFGYVSDLIAYVVPNIAKKGLHKRNLFIDIWNKIF